jgi:hypothetical protein
VGTYNLKPAIIIKNPLTAVFTGEGDIAIKKEIIAVPLTCSLRR